MRINTIIAPFVASLLLSAASYAGTSDVADAAMNRDQAAIRTLLTKKADVNAPQTDGTTALHWAVHHEDLALVDQLLRAGAKAMVANREGATPLYLASVAANPVIMDKLLKNGVDVNAPVLRHGETPLMFAARTGRPEAVKLLLEAGAQVAAKETLRQTTALMWAAEQGHGDVIRLLVAGGAEVNANSTIEAVKGRRYGCNSCTGDAPVTGGVTALVLAARQGNLDAVRVLAESGADINKASGDGSTAMLVAIQNGHYDVARYLVEKGADINLANQKGWTPLYLAVKHRNLETGTIPVPNQNQATDFVKLLLDRDVDVNARVKANTEIRNGQRATWFNEVGATAFMRAALCGDIEMMRMLLAKGADPKIATEDGTTALMAASGVGYSEGFIHYRSKEESIQAVKLLLELGADVNAQNEGGLSALHGAAHRAALGEIKLLVEHGASLTLESKPAARFGNSKVGLLPLDWAQGVPVGVQSAIYHADAVDLITRMMNERGIAIPERHRTLGGNAAVAGTK
jgi:ankyrin repeat protein